MADYPMQLQKPPGYRDPNMETPSPPPPFAQQPIRKSSAMPFRPQKKRRSCCRFCCCCVCITLVIFIFLLLIGTAIFYFWFDPKLPTFSLSSFRIDDFKLADNPDGASLSATPIARVELKNPNSKLAFYYGNTDVEMSVGTGNDETRMGDTTVSGFRQGPKNSTSLKLETSLKNQIVEKAKAKRLGDKYQSKDLVINVVAKTKVGLAVGGIKIGMLDVDLRCGGVSLNKLETQSPKCILNTLRWVKISHEKEEFGNLEKATI